MSYLQRIVSARAAYLAALAERREAFRSQVDVCRSEFMVRLHGETPLLGNLYVLDTAGVDGTRFCAHGADGEEISIDETVETDTGKRIAFQGLCWSRTLFRTVGAPLPLEQITTWFDRWIGDASDQGEVPNSFVGIHDWFAPHAVETGVRARLPRFALSILGRAGGRGIEVAGPVNDEGFRGVIHGCALRSDNEIAIDFGTATIGAFDELVTILEQSDAEEIVIRPEREARDLYELVLEMLQTQHDKEYRMDAASAAEEFFEWFAGNADRFGALMDEMRTLQIGKNPKDFDKGLAIHQKIMSQALPEIEAIHEDLVVDIANGNEKANNLIISAGSDPALVQTVRDVVGKAPDLPDWEVTAFRPPRPLAFSIDMNVPCLGDLSIDPDQIRVSLGPRLDRIDVAVHIDGMDAQTRLVLKETAAAAVERVLGEIAFIDGAGEISVTPDSGEGVEAFPINELEAKFAAAAAGARQRAESLPAENEPARIDAMLSLLSDDLDAFEAVLAEFAEIHDVRIRLDLWSDSDDVVEKIDDAFPDFRSACEPGTSILGTGWNIVTTGVSPVKAGGLRDWLAETLAPAIAAGAILVRVSEAELYIDGMIEELDQKATELLDAGDWSSAAQIMRPLLARFGEVEEGRMHAKTGHCYLLGGHYEHALRFFTQALDALTDEAWKGEAHTNTAICLQNLGRMPEALPHYVTSLEMDPSSALRHYNLGQAYALIGDPDKACSYLRKAADLDPDHAKRVMEDPDLNPIRNTEPFVALARDLAA